MGRDSVKHRLAGFDGLLAVVIEEDRPLRMLKTRLRAMRDVGHVDELVVSGSEQDSRIGQESARALQ